MLNTKYVLLDKDEGESTACGIIAIVDGIARDYAFCSEARRFIAQVLVEKLNRLNVEYIHFRDIISDNML